MMQIPAFSLGPAACLALALPAVAAFDDLGAGARAPGMGGAFVAIADDVYAVHYNAAGLGALEHPELGLTYGRLYAGLSDRSNLGQTHLTYAQPLRSGRWGALGLAWQELRLDSTYNERAVGLSYGRLAWAKSSWGSLFLGTQLRSLSRGFRPGPEADNSLSHGAAVGEADPALQGLRGQSALAADLGLLWRAPRRWAFGLAVSQLNEPDIGFRSAEKLPLKAQAGLSYKSLWMNLAGDIRHETAADGKTTRHFVLAAERFFPSLELGELGLRASIGLGAADSREVTAGLSYKINKVRVDYAFLMPLAAVEGALGVHRVGLSFLFGALSPEEEYARELLGQVERQRLRESAGLESERQAFGLPAALREPRLAAVRVHIERGEFAAAERQLGALLSGTRSAPTLEHIERRLAQVAAAFPDLLEPRDRFKRALFAGCRNFAYDMDRAALLHLAYAASLAPGNERLARLLATAEAETGLRAEKPAARVDLLQTKQQRSQQAFARRDYQTALEEARDAHELEPGDIRGLKRLGSALFMINHHFEAIAAWDAALGLETAPAERARLESHIAQSKRALEQGATPPPARPAPTARRLALPKLSPGSLDARVLERLYQQGMGHYARGELDQAQAAFERILDSDPSNTQARKALSRVLRGRP